MNEPTPGDAIVITGAGMVTCLGADRESTWRAVLDGRSGFGPMSAMEQRLPEGKDGGQAVDLPDDDDSGEPREVRYFRRAIRQALVEAGFGDGAQIPYPSDRCGVLVGTTLHGMRSAGRYLRTGDFDPLRQFLAVSTLRGAGKDLSHVTGIAATTCSACSSSLGSVALAMTLLRAGELDLVFAGGYDPVSEYVYGGFNSLRVVADGPLRPFSRGRSGMKLAEGYGAVVLERAADARRRGVTKTVARVLGYGESADAHHLTQPHPQGDGAARAMIAAMKSAGLRPEDIDLVAAHATGTPDNDASEFAALSRAFGDALPRTPVVGFKSHLGHTLGGAGVVELILSAMALRDQVVPVCANVNAEDVEFAGLNLSTGSPKKATLRRTLNTSLGFGGANTCVVLEHPVGAALVSPSVVAHVTEGDTSVAPTRTARHDVFITGVGVVLPGAVGNDAFRDRLLSATPTRLTEDAGAIGDDAIAHLLNARRVRRMSEYVKLSLAATTLALQDAGVDDVPAFAATCSAVLGSTHGSANYSADYYGQVVREGVAAANPLLFAEGVPNAAAAHLSLMLALKGACQTIIGARTAGLDALRLAAARVAAGEWDRAVVGAGEEYSRLVNDAYRHCGVYGAARDGGGFVTGCGAVTLVLESRRSIAARGGPAPRGAVEAWSSAASFRESRGEIESARRVLWDIGPVESVIGSANGTWIDRAEAAAVRHSAAPRQTPRTYTTLDGHVAETFSVNPLASVAAVLLTGRTPALLRPLPTGLAAPDPAARPRSVGVLCSDYAGLVAGCRIGLGERSAA